MADEKEIKEGDVVELRSGGPSMTVERAISAAVIKCAWFDAGRRSKTRPVRVSLAKS